MPEALDALLKGTHLNAVVTDKGVIVVSSTPETQRVNREERNVKTKQNKLSLLSRVALILFGAVNTQGVSAQDPASGQEAEAVIEEVVVRGSFASAVNSINNKRNNFRIVDTISADDLGTLPDFNVAEAIARAPGIMVQDDQGEGRYVSIRGLAASFNYVTIDGSAVAVADRDGREVFFDSMPSAMADRLEVFKVFAPDAEGGAMGGILNIVSPSAFDRDDLFFKIDAEIGTYENDDGYNDVDPSGNVSGLGSYVFGDSGQFGVVVAGNFYRRDSFAPRTEYGNGAHYFDATGSEVAAYDSASVLSVAPSERRFHWYHNKRTRYGGLVKLEHKPDDSRMYSWIKAYYNTGKDDEARQTDVIDYRGGAIVTDHTTTGGTLVGGTFRNRQYFGKFEFERAIWGVQGGTEIDLGNDSRLEVRLNYAGSLFENPEIFTEWRNDSTDYAYSYQFNDDRYAITVDNPVAESDFTQLGINRRDITDRKLNEDIYEVRADYGKNYDFSEDGGGFKVGASFRRINRDFNEDQDRFSGATGNTFTLAAANVVTTDVCGVAPGATPDNCIITVDQNALSTSFESHLAANPGEWLLDMQPTNDNRRDYGIEEDVWSAYGMLTYATGSFRIVGGLRYEDTDVTGNGRRAISGGFEPTSSDGGFSEILPSIQATFNATNDIIVRAGFSQSFSRAPFNVLAPAGESVSFGGTLPTVRTSNPDILPRTADNYDLSAEWYIDEGLGLLSAAFFYKNIENDFITVTETENFDFGDGLQLVDITRPGNSQFDTDVFGLELNVIKTLDFLPVPGFSISANATWLDTDGRDPNGTELDTLLGQANEIYNVALIYTGFNIDARLAYNNTGRNLFQIRGNPDQHVYIDKHQQLDLKVSYAVTDKIGVSFNAWNLTDEERFESSGRFNELPRRIEQYGRAFFVGASYSLF